MTGILLISEPELAAITAALARARQHPIPWKALAPRVVDDDTPYLKLKDRKGGGARPQSEMVALPVGYRLNISYEHQPAGLCLHISVSSPNPGHDLPNALAMALVAKACGMQWPPGNRSRMWIEDFVAGPMVGKAVNLVEVVELAQ